jgi:hypothetical protein
MGLVDVDLGHCRISGRSSGNAFGGRDDLGVTVYRRALDGSGLIPGVREREVTVAQHGELVARREQSSREHYREDVRDDGHPEAPQRTENAETIKIEHRSSRQGIAAARAGPLIASSFTSGRSASQTPVWSER